MANFEYLLFRQEYKMFAASCAEAERVYHTSPAMCAIGCRKGLEMAVKWLYLVDDTLNKPYSDNLQALIHEESFRDAVDPRTWNRMPYIIKTGNLAVHSAKTVTPGEALACLHNLFDFVQWIEYCYAENYTPRKFNDADIPQAAVAIDQKKVLEQQSLLEENEREMAKLREQLAQQEEALKAARAANEDQNHRPIPPEPTDDISEFRTRKQYIDVDLKRLGWKFDNIQIIEEYEVDNMAGVPGAHGYCDYVLFGQDGLPLAVIEAKKTSRDPRIGRNQAQYYADALERRFGRRPMIFLSNGFETLFWDNLTGPERQVGGFFSRDDLQRAMNRRGMQGNLDQTPISDSITGRYYQKEAIRAVCEHIDQKFRKNLIVMATGTGKTRTAASLVDVLSRANYVTNVLFLADRRALVSQARDSFKQYLPSYSLCNLLENREDANARIVFSTYPTILNAIDSRKTEEGLPLYTPAHFDLIIVDESHRSIFKKYRAIFQYFDAILVGLTATPKTDVDRNTYDFFECENGVPTYSYDYDTAVYQDHYLVPYYNIEVRTNTLSNGIHYDDLSEEEKERYEEDFTEDDGSMEKDIDAQRIDRNVFNQSTVDMVLQDLMRNGIHLAGGDRLAKTIIFAQNKRHAEFIVERFNALFPMYGGTYCKRVICEDTYAQSVIDEFKRPAPPLPWSADSEVDPQIVVSVDMMDTGIDVPQLANLVFFKKVFSKIKFWQMIGRGTRRCDELQCLDGQSGEYTGKKYFYIFDYCGNFDFFRENPNGIKGSDTASLDEVLFAKRIRIAAKLQNEAYMANADLKAFRQSLVETCCGQVQNLNDEFVLIRMKRELVEKYRDILNYADLDDMKVKELTHDLAPIVMTGDSDEGAKNYDNLIFTAMLACLENGEHFQTAKARLMKYSGSLLKKLTVPQVAQHEPMIRKTAEAAFWEEKSIIAYEQVRQELRELIRFLDHMEKSVKFTDLIDTELERREGDALPASEEFADYKTKVNRYIAEHRDTLVIYKLSHNEPLTEMDYSQLAQIFTTELGTQEDYARDFQNTPFGLLVRKITGLDHEAVMNAFSEFINDQNLNARQISFVKKIISYVETNGYLEDRNLTVAPFDRPAPITSLFDAKQMKRLLDTIHALKDNAGTRFA